MTLTPIAHIHSPLASKFGIPRQSGIVPGLKAQIVFTPQFRIADALRGIEEFSHIWLIWGFSQAPAEGWNPTVRPPRLGGNKRLGVFATRSPFRPNPIGLSCVELENVEAHPLHGPVLHVLGADLMDGTPIYDIKPYLPYADCRPNAAGGFAAEPPRETLNVEIGNRWLQLIPEEDRDVLIRLLACDPRPRYHDDAARVYGMAYGGFNVRFTVDEDKLTVVEVTKG